MNETIKKDIIDIIAQAVEIIKEGNPYDLKELSNHTIHNASIFQDEFSVAIAVIIYSLSKIISANSESKGKFAGLLVKARKSMEQDDITGYKAATGSIMDLISKLDSRFGGYVDDVISQAQIRKASKIYDHGISLGQTSSILGISQWELMQYLGAARGTDSPYEKSDVIEKLKYTRRLFE
jgi:hypothetical protein